MWTHLIRSSPTVYFVEPSWRAVNKRYTACLTVWLDIDKSAAYSTRHWPPRSKSSFRRIPFLSPEPNPEKILSPECLVKGKIFDYRFGLGIKNHGPPPPPPPWENSKSRALGKGKNFWLQIWTQHQKSRTPPHPEKILSPECLVKGKIFDYRFGLSIKNHGPLPPPPPPPPPWENSKSRALGKGKNFWLQIWTQHQKSQTPPPGMCGMWCCHLACIWGELKKFDTKFLHSVWASASQIVSLRKLKSFASFYEASFPTQIYLPLETKAQPSMSRSAWTAVKNTHVR